jgi:hypothetical protein
VWPSRARAEDVGPLPLQLGIVGSVEQGRGEPARQSEREVQAKPAKDTVTEGSRMKREQEMYTARRTPVAGYASLCPLGRQMMAKRRDESLHCLGLGVANAFRYRISRLSFA